MNLPNILSISRILLLIPIIFFFELGWYLFSTFVFVIAAITDFLDGYFARKNNQNSDIGALLDLLADKLFVSILLIWITFNFNNIAILISSILIISREISISYIRMYFLSLSGEIKETKSDKTGKYKTTSQMIGLGLILASPLTPNFIFNFSLVLIFFSALISWYSLIKYLKKWIV
jgi:CDP-diacylglycerol--glycerol-3-phosphate 3-phosphatidyltransferase